jgi:hypothetical protein
MNTNKLISCKPILLAMLIVVVPVGSGSNAESASEVAVQKTQDEIRMAAKEASFARFMQDFTDISKSLVQDSATESAGIEASMAVDLGSLAERANSVAHSARVLLSIYNKLSYREDKAAALTMMKEEFNFGANLLASTTGKLNFTLSRTRLPSVAQLGLRFKDEIRETESMLEMLSK